MINNFKKNTENANIAIDNMLPNKDDYKPLSKVAHKNHQANIEKANDHTHFKYDPSLSSHIEKVCHNPNANETAISHAGTRINGIMI